MHNQTTYCNIKCPHCDETLRAQAMEGVHLCKGCGGLFTLRKRKKPTVAKTDGKKQKTQKAENVEKMEKMENNVIEKKNEVSASERFTSMVFREFGANAVGEPQVTDHQRSLISNYFICIDRVLKTADAERIRRNEKNSDHQYDNTLPINWKSVNMTDLALDLVHYARMGLDMLQPNMLFPIPYKNNKSQKYDITLMKGYNGIRYIAEKYGVETPKAVTAEVVYSTDKFRPIKKNASSEIETYEFEITSPFDRGSIIGGFAYLEFRDPANNKLILMSLKDILKRKPQYASVNFWGGTERKKINGEWVENTVEGWLDEMVRKTILREAYSPKHIPIDPAKVDEAYRASKLREVRYAEIEADAEAEANANSIVIDVTEETASEEEKVIVLDPQSGEVTEADVPPLF